MNKHGYSCVRLRHLCLAAALGLATPSVEAGQWSQSEVAPQDVEWVFTHPLRPGVLYAIADQSLMVSEDMGHTWAVVVGFGPYRPLLDPTDPNVMYAAGGWSAARSFDGGRSWEIMTGPDKGEVAIHQIAGVTFDLEDSTKLYAVGFDAGVFRSRNRGDTWTQLSQGLPYDIRVQALDARGNRLLAACDRGIYRSTDAGASWTTSLAVSPGGPQFVQIVSHPSNPNLVYAGSNAGVYRSENGGQTWQNLGLNAFLIRQFLLDDADASRVWAVTGGGVFVSSDRGNNWTRPQGGFPASALARDPGNTSLIYAGTWSGIWVSNNGAASWTPRTLTRVAALAVDPRDSNRIFAGSIFSGFFVSEDAGRSWTWQVQGLLDGNGLPHAIHTVQLDPSNADRILVGTSNGVYRSSNRGRTWAQSGLPGINVVSMAVHPSAASVWLAGTENKGVFKSTDSGQNWTLSSGGLPQRSFYYSTMTTLLFDPRNPQVAYLLDGGVRKSTDGGATWVLRNEGFTDQWGYPVYASGLAAAPDGVLYATVPYSSLYRSDDGALNWRRVGGGVGGIRITYSPHLGGILYESGGFQAPRRSSDGGLTWTWLAGGLKMSAAYNLEILGFDPNRPDIIYLGSGAGIFRWDSSICFGDVTGDGLLENIDLYAIQEHLSGFRRLRGAASIAADVNGDGVVNILDHGTLNLILKGQMTVPDCSHRPWGAQ